MNRASGFLLVLIVVLPTMARKGGFFVSCFSG